MAANIQLQSAAVDPLLRGLVDTSVVKVPFVKPPIGAVCAPFTHTRASFGLNTALPANCSLPFNSYLSVPQYCLISNSFLKVTVTVPANTQPMQYAPIFMFDSIDLLNADGRSFWQARPESTFVYINQCMEADLKLAAKNLVLAAETDCADAATAGTFTACVEFYKTGGPKPQGGHGWHVGLWHGLACQVCPARGPAGGVDCAAGGGADHREGPPQLRGAHAVHVCWVPDVAGHHRVARRPGLCPERRQLGR